MAVRLAVRDEIMAPRGGDNLIELEFQTESITVRELIRERVYQEVLAGDLDPRDGHVLTLG